MMIQAAVLSLVAASRAAVVGEQTEQADVCNEAAQEGCDEASLLQLRGKAEQVKMRKDDVTLGDEPQTITLEANDPWGPLTGLIGKWQSENGYNFVALPMVENGLAKHTVVVNKYRETITFKAIDGGVLNRGYEDANQVNPQTNQNQILLGLSYHLEAHDLLTTHLIHQEDGQFLWNEEPGLVSDWTVARMAEIPHGNSPQQLGLNSTLTGAEVKQTLTEMVNQVEWSIKPQFPEGQFVAVPPCPTCRTACAKAGVNEDVCATPVQKLLDDSIPFSSIQKAVKLDVRTSFPGGSMGGQLPGIKRQVFNQKFNATFFIESVTGGGSSDDYTQLQYVQNVFFTFECQNSSSNRSDCNLPEHADANILWPHVQVNTLTKVPEPRNINTDVDKPLTLPATVR